MSKNIPEIRFDGFNGEWVQRQLYKVAEFNPKSELPDKFEYVDLESVVGTEMISHRTEAKDSAPSRAKRLAQTGDVFFQTVRPYQKNNYLFSKPDKNYVFSTGYAQMRPEIDAEFLMCFLQTDSFVKVVLDNCTGTSYPAINSNDLSNLEINFPALGDEQREIGRFISNLDRLIILHQQKYDKLVAMKKSMLDKMFPKKGSNVPEIRFAGFDEPWEERKIGDSFTERVESMPDGELISVTINNGIKKFSELGRHDNSNEDKSKYKKVCVGDIAYNSMRMWQGASGYSPYEGIVSPAYTVLSPTEGICSKCIAYQFKLPEMIHVFRINSQGITSDNWNLKYPALSEIKIYVAKDIKEQELIAEYFSLIDNLITLQQQELEKLKNIKKALLDKMFV